MLFEATNNFSNDHKIGTGSFFSVYHVNDGREVAIKCKNGACACKINLKALYRHSHNNLVCLLGFCEDSIKPIWVYEYMKNGSLHDHLHKLQSSPLMSSWATRIKVALDAAKGIEYLHVHAVTPIIHDGESKSRGLAEYLGELQLKDDANDRYIAALRRETLGRNPYVRRFLVAIKNLHITVFSLANSLLFAYDGESKSRGLAEYLGELQLKDDANDRYIAALRRETLGRNPYVRRVLVAIKNLHIRVFSQANSLLFACWYL
ncbi:putative serine/threonine-protein kinase-like protein CCR3 [Quercus suber]|uniref:putative serine/threonine-protein kinase-like protein CCR3 n=1 Tax=Quercus suber TaxID=58331 RepID=UPI0032DF52BF